MSARLAIALGLLVAGLAAAAAQPTIPPGEMAGRERFRFIETPTERYMRPGPYVEQPVIEAPARKYRSRQHGHRKHRQR